MSLALISTSGVFTTNIVEGDKAETIAPIVSGTAVTATGTSIDFTGIPNWVKRVTVALHRVSTNGASNLRLRVRVNNAVVTTNYFSGATVTGSGAASTNDPAGFLVTVQTSAAAENSGILELIRLNASTWSYRGTISPTNSPSTTHSAGSVTFTGNLDGINLSTVNGTDVFDLGTVNINWE